MGWEHAFEVLEPDRSGHIVSVLDNFYQVRGFLFIDMVDHFGLFDLDGAATSHIVGLIG